MTKPEPVRRLILRGEGARNHEAAALASAPGDAATVNRGRLRSIIIACPDGCGEHITINLDNEAGPAWRLYTRSRGVSLFPSVWRDSGCRSHFIVWDSTILWCDAYVEVNREPEPHVQELDHKVLALLTASYRSYVEMALVLDEVPWEVSRSCRKLVAKGMAEEDDDPSRGHFRLPKEKRS